VLAGCTKEASRGFGVVVRRLLHRGRRPHSGRRRVRAYDYQQFQSDLYVVEGLRRADRATAGSVAVAGEDGMARPSKVHDGEDVSVFGGTGAMKTSLAVGAIVTSLAAVPGGSAAADDARLPAGRKWVRMTAPAIAKQPVIGDLVARGVVIGGHDPPHPTARVLCGGWLAMTVARRPRAGPPPAFLRFARYRRKVLGKCGDSRLTDGNGSRICPGCRRRPGARRRRESRDDRVKPSRRSLECRSPPCSTD
jgi:hypothetical protein